MNCKIWTRWFTAVIILLLPGAVLTGAPAGDEEKQVIAVVNQFFTMLETRDAELGKKILQPGGVSFSTREKDNKIVFKGTGFQALIDSIPNIKSDLKEVMENPKVLLHKNIAVLWAEYKFYVNGEFSHCGVDAFNLLKTEEGWKITGILYTVEKDGCPKQN